MKRKIIYIIGDTDTGKTTFSSFLIQSLAERYFTGFIDCDPGQTTIGPPCTVGLGIYWKGKKKVRIKNPDAVYLRFIGATTPSGHLLQTVAGVKRLTEKAIEHNVEKLIIDSSGYVQGSTAKMFQYYMIDMVKPDYIIEMYTTSSLKSLLLNFAGSAEIIRIKASDSAKQKNPQIRRLYREDQFRLYFKSAHIFSLPYNNVGLHGRIPDFYDRESCSDLLLALHNRNNFVMTLGIIKSIDVNNREVTLLSPPVSKEKVKSIHFGSIRCDASGLHG